MTSSSARRGERGAALIVALCVLATVAMLVASAVALSKISAENYAAATGRAEARYMAESCASRCVWLLINDIGTHPARALGVKVAAGPVKEERFMADGAPHSFALCGGEGTCMIFDMVSGPDISGRRGGIAVASLFGGASGIGQPQAQGQTLAQGKAPAQGQAAQGQTLPDDVRIFVNRLDDYCDPSEFVRPDGMKRRDYEAAGLRGLPRSGPLLFREEILLVPGFERLFPEPDDGVLDYFMPVAPEGMPSPQGRPSFFSAGSLTLRLLGKLSDEEAGMAVKARDDWRSGGRDMRETMSPALLLRLQTGLSFMESGFYRIVAKGSLGGGASPATVTMSLRIAAQPQGNGVTYYEWMQY
jgi:hypothetical protein